MAARPVPVWEAIVSPVVRLVVAAARTSFRSTSDSGASSTPIFMNAGLIDVPSMPLLELARPARRKLVGALGERKTGEMLVLRGAVVAGIREDVQAGRLGQPLQQRDVAPQVGGRALDERAAAVLSGLEQVRQDGSERVIRVVALRADLIGADEVDQHVLVHQRQAQARRRDRAGHRLHEPSRIRRLTGGHSRDGCWIDHQQLGHPGNPFSSGHRGKRL